MARNVSPIALVGSTGLVGSKILSTLLTLLPKPSIHSITRRALSNIDPEVNSVVEQDSSRWPEVLTKLDPTPKIFISALGTTMAQAGSFKAQRAIDHDLNLALVRSAKESGATIYVLISTAASSPTSLYPYLKMKGELEEAVKALEIPYTILVQPGVLLGDRNESRPAEAILSSIAKGLGAISKRWLTDWWAQDVVIIGKAVVAAVLQCDQGIRQPGIWVIGQKDIIKLGETNKRPEQ